MNLRSLLASRAKKAVFSIILVIVVLAASVYSYTALSPPNEGPKASVISPPLEFSMHLERAEFQQGEIVNVSLTVINMSNKTLELLWGDGRIFDLIVDDVNGTRVWNWQSFHAYVAAEVEKNLNPGGRLSYYFWWGQTVPYEGVAGPYPAGQVPKGTYFIKGALTRFTLRVEDQVTGESLETPTVAININ
jgi:hypothetical protein